jgi:signal transduction histidine kinase
LPRGSRQAEQLGLGLSIVKEICESLQGEIVLGVPDQGSGLHVDVRLPLAMTGTPAESLALQS